MKLAREVAIREGHQGGSGRANRFVGSGLCALGTAHSMAETGEELVAHRETAEDGTALIPAVDRLSKWLRERVGESLRTVRSSPPLAQVRTASLEALRLYTEAYDVRGGRRPDRERVFHLLDRAIELDSTFASAYTWRALYWSGGLYGRARTIADVTRAYELRHRLPPFEQLNAEAVYYREVVLDYDKVINAYRSMLELKPDDIGTLQMLAVTHRFNGDYARVEELSRHGIALDSLAVAGWFNLVYAQFNLGKFDEAKESLRQWEILRPELQTIPYLRSFIASASFDYSAFEIHIQDYLAAIAGDLLEERDVEWLRAAELR